MRIPFLSRRARTRVPQEAEARPEEKRRPPRRRRGRRAATSMEYVVVASFILVVVIAALHTFGVSVNSLFGSDAAATSKAAVNNGP